MADLTINMTLDEQKASVLGLPRAVVNTNPFYNATELDRQGRHKEAEKIYLELLNADFSNPVVLAALGMSYAALEKNGLAEALLARSLERVDDLIAAFKRVGVTPKDSNPVMLQSFVATKKAEILNALGTCYKHENKTEQARQLFFKAQEAIPLNADIQNNLGTLYINEGDPRKALEFLDLAVSLQPGHPQASWNQSLAHLELGDYEKGWATYDAGMAAKVRAERNYAATPLPTWDGSPGKNVVVYGEQGIGDEIMFASCLQEVIDRSNLVVFDCHKKLHTLFANSFPTIDIYPTREDEALTWPVKVDRTPRYPLNARIALGSLPRLLRPNLESFPGKPFIKPPVEAEAMWCARLNAMSDRPKIGISWIGGHKRTRIEVRSLALEQLLPILKHDADFISLQYTNCSDEIAAFERQHGIKIHQFNEVVQSPNYADTAALVANLDLVITVCTSVVHLAGSMGVPTWVLTPSRPAWRYRLDLDYMPWYGRTVTLFRQAHGSTDWTPVVEEVSSKLQDLIGAIA